MKCPNCGNDKFYVCYEYDELNNNNVYLIVEEIHEEGWITILHPKKANFIPLSESEDIGIEAIRSNIYADIDVCTKCGTALS